MISTFEEMIGTSVLGNKPASGTEIIKDWRRTYGHRVSIVYTSADSVFQIAAHEEIIGLDRLWRSVRWRQLLQGEHGVGRVIARPFVEARCLSEN